MSLTSIDNTNLDTAGGDVSAARTGRQPAKFTRETVAELRKVTWPTGKQTVRYTGIVLAFLTVMVAFIGGVDAGAGALARLVFG